jgi:hypothetical protein
VGSSATWRGAPVVGGFLLLFLACVSLLSFGLKLGYNVRL